MADESEVCTSDYRKREEARRILSEMARMTGKHYRVSEEALLALSLGVLQELRRFVQDAEFEATLKAKKAAMQPWRRF